MSQLLRRAKADNRTIVVGLAGVLITIQFLLSGPILEGYGVVLNSKNYFHFFPSIASRPASLIPEFLAGFFGGNSKWGYFFVGVVFTLIKMWLLLKFTKHFSKIETLNLSLIIFLMSPWLNFMNERYFPAQLSALLCLIGFYQWMNKTNPLLICLSMFIAGTAYPPAATTMIIVGIILALLRIDENFKNLAILVAGCFIFLAYYEVINHVVKKSYDAQVIGKITLRNIGHLYLTTYLSSAAVTLIVILIVTIISFKIAAESKIQIIYIIASLLILLPICSIGFASNFLHVNDIDRVLFPIFLGLSVLLIRTFFLATSPKQIQTELIVRRPLLATALTLSILVYSTTFLAPWFSNYSFNTKLVNIVTEFELKHHEKSLLILDKTGHFGDVNTLFNGADVLSESLALKGINISTEICNSGQNYLKTIASRFPIPAAANCDQVDISKYPTILLIFKLHPFTFKYVKPISGITANEYLIKTLK